MTRAGTLSAQAGAAKTQRAATITRCNWSTEYSGRRAASVPTVICTSAATAPPPMPIQAAPPVPSSTAPM